MIPGVCKPLIRSGSAFKAVGQGWISDYYEYGDTYNNLFNDTFPHAYKAINHLHLMSLVQIPMEI